jgi:hypothetical protein
MKMVNSSSHFIALLPQSAQKQIYTPRTGASPYPAHKLLARVGMNTVLVTPFCVHGQQFAGCINAYMEEEDGFSALSSSLVLAPRRSQVKVSDHAD